MSKCDICGREEDDHRYRVTTFERGADPKTIHQRTRGADRAWVEEGFFWVEDSGVKEGTNLTLITGVIVTDLEATHEERSK